MTLAAMHHSINTRLSLLLILLLVVWPLKGAIDGLSLPLSVEGGMSVTKPATAGVMTRAHQQGMSPFGADCAEPCGCNGQDCANGHCLLCVPGLPHSFTLILASTGGTRHDRFHQPLSRCFGSHPYRPPIA